jgi:hypothetical protein
VEVIIKINVLPNHSAKDKAVVRLHHTEPFRLDRLWR